MPSTIPNEFDRVLTEAEQALIKVRHAAFGAASLGEPAARILAEAKFGIATAARLSGGQER